ncbi:MAG: dihydrofolate reductase [Microgenomates group bacterium]|jgi:dihydrofolate reductase
MSKPKISIICCIGKNRGIGKDNQLLWHIPEDLQHFKQITEGHPVIMGRKTFESIGRPLPNRLNIILTHNPLTGQPGVVFAFSLEEALKMAAENEKEEIFIIGGGQVYQEAISLADKLYLTVVEDSPEADTFFPDYSDFKKVISSQKNKNKDYSFTYLELER